ncbi:MAG: hypothetical protein ACTHNP_10900 [Solirubrobacterales bacterium]
MREKLNENPLAQIAVVGILIAVAAIFLLKGGGGESESESEPAESGSTTTSAPAITPAGETPSTGGPIAPPEAPPPPKAVTAAFNSDQTVVLLIVRPGGIDDDMVKVDTEALAAVPNVALFVVPVRKIAQYAAITEGAGVNRVPALVVLRPKNLSHGVPTASVNYGYQGAQSVVQAVVDARYKGRTLSYHP